MTPIVNGLESEFRTNILFLYLNAADAAEGQRTFEALYLPGHPSFVIFQPDGREVYRGFGIVEADTLRNAIASSLETGASTSSS